MEGDDDTLEDNLLNELTNDDLYVELEDMLGPDVVFGSNSAAVNRFRSFPHPSALLRETAADPIDG